MATDTKQYASFGPRFLAYVVDAILVSIINFVLGYVIGMALGNQASNIAGLIGLVVGVGYHVYFWTKEGATPGKKALGLRVQKLDGSSLDVVSALLRYVGYFVSAVVVCLGFLWIIWDPKKQGWHDKIAGTVVIKAK